MVIYIRNHKYVNNNQCNISNHINYDYSYTYIIIVISIEMSLKW